MTARTERMGKLVKEEVSEILRKDVSDPRIGFISITDVDFTEDLQLAKIYVSIFGDEKTKKETMEGLKSATGFIRGELAPRLDLKVMPKIVFIRDDSIERGSKLIALMDKLEREKKKLIQKKKKRKK